jgi:hypothetical protein
MCPNSLYAGMRQLNLGEHLQWKPGRLQVGRHWSPYHDAKRYTSKREAAEVTAGVLAEAATRYVQRGPIVADLTGGYDSGLVASALCGTGSPFAVTVNGDRQHPDVAVAHRVAHVAGWRMIHFGEAFSGRMTGAMRRAAAFMSGGELSAAQFYLHIVTRPILRRTFVAHVQGGGGELIRNFPWGQEFAGIGRYRPASVDRVLSYRLLAGHSLPEAVFRIPFYSILREDLRSRVQVVIEDGAGTRTTQQLDAIFILKLTGHFGAYTSSLFDLLPTGVPLLHRTFIEHGVSLPWTMRLTAGLARRTLAILDPRAAAVETCYGSTGGPPTLKTLPLELRQAGRTVRHFANKIDRVVLKGRLGRVIPLGMIRQAVPDPPFRTEELRMFLNSASLFSRGLYDSRILASLLTDPSTPSESLSRIATLEHVCQELGTEPGPELLRA